MDSMLFLKELSLCSIRTFADIICQDASLCPDNEALCAVPNEQVYQIIDAGIGPG